MAENYDWGDEDGFVPITRLLKPTSGDDPEVVEDKTEFIEEITRGFERITREEFVHKCQEWETQFQRLETYDELIIRAELRQWDLTIPQKECFDLSQIYDAYSRNVNYRTRVAHLIGTVNAHFSTYSYAHKELKEIALGLSERVAKNQDKAAYAAQLTEVLIRQVSRAKSTLDYLVEMRAAIEHAATNLARLLRERENLAKINQDYNSRGMQSRLANEVKTRPTIPQPVDLVDDDEGP